MQAKEDLTQQMLKQLFVFDLEELLYTLCQLNNGSGFITRLEKCIEIAEELNRWSTDGETFEKSLPNFLKEIATENKAESE